MSFQMFLKMQEEDVEVKYAERKTFASVLCDLAAANLRPFDEVSVLKNDEHVVLRFVVPTDGMN